MSVYQIIPYPDMNEIRYCETGNYLGLIDDHDEAIEFDPTGLEIARKKQDDEEQDGEASGNSDNESPMVEGEEVDEIYPYSFKDLIEQYLSTFENYNEYRDRFEECSEHIYALITYNIDGD